jgi:hypothetical protein
MTTGNDDDLQAWLDSADPDSGLSDFQAADLRSYRSLFELLGQEPPYGLPADFSARVVRRVKAKSYHKIALRKHSRIALLFAGGLTVSYLMMPVISCAPLAALLTTFWAYKGILLFSSCLLIVIQYLDAFLIKRRMSSSGD